MRQLSLWNLFNFTLDSESYRNDVFIALSLLSISEIQIEGHVKVRVENCDASDCSETLYTSAGR